MKTANKMIMSIIGLVLIAAAILKVHQILTTIIPNFAQIQTQYNGFEFLMRMLDCREFVIFHVPLEIGLGIWLICSLFRKAAWLAGIIVFAFFCFVTGYKVVHGYADCGCFGVVKINPLITLIAVDIPAVLLLAIFWPRGSKLLPPPWPSAKHFFAVAIPTFALLIGITAYLLASPPVEPEPIEKTGQLWDKLQHIDVAEKLASGMWVVLLYHNDCPNCKEAIPEYEKIAPAYKDSISFAFIEVPPYGDPSESIVSDNTTALVGKLDQSKNWMIQTPRIILLVDGQVIKTWEIKAPTMDEIFASIE